MCRLDHRTLSTKLQGLAGSDNSYLLLDIYGPGHAVYTAGATAYVTKCKEVDAKFGPFPNCTQQIPVSLAPNTTTKFVDPFTLVLRQYPTIVPCDSLMPIRWKVGTDWYCSTPKISKCEAPGQLNLTVVDFVAEKDITEGVGIGIFTRAQLLAHKAYVVAVNTRDAVLSYATHAAIAAGNGLNAIGAPISAADFAGMREDIGNWIAPISAIVGDSYKYLMLGLLSFGIVKVIGATISRAIVIQRHEGWTWYMIAAVWQGAFQVMAIPWTLTRTFAKSATAPLRVDPNDISARQNAHVNRRLADIEQGQVELGRDLTLAQAQRIADVQVLYSAEVDGVAIVHPPPEPYMSRNFRRNEKRLLRRNAPPPPTDLAPTAPQEGAVQYPGLPLVSTQQAATQNQPGNQQNPPPPTNFY